MVQNKYYESEDDEYFYDDDDHSAATENDNNPAATNISKSHSDDLFVVGDHVYKWCSHFGVRYQHHGIVVEILSNEEEELMTGNGQNIVIVDFTLGFPDSEEQQSTEGSCVAGGSSSVATNAINGSIAGPGNMRRLELIEEEEKNEWQKVHYGIEDDETNIKTTTATASDPKYLVLGRANFLLCNPSILPPYGILKSNCECVAVWCKTGKWTTLQGKTILNLLAPSSVDVVAGAAVVTASSTSVTVPATGTAGLLGLTTEVSAVVAYPALLPIIGAVGIGSYFALWCKKKQCIKFSEKMSDTLNKEFCAFLVEHATT